MKIVFLPETFLSPIIKDKSSDPIVALPLLQKTHNTLETKDIRVTKTNVAYDAGMTPVGLPGGIILSGRTSSSALSYIEVTGPSLKSSAFTFMAWILPSHLDKTTTLLDSRQYESSTNLHIEVNMLGQLNVSTPDGQILLTPSTNGIKAKQWNFLAFTYSTFDGKGGLMINEHFGFENGTSNEVQKGNYFFYESSSWISDSTQYPIRIGGNKFDYSRNFQGQLSCVQFVHEMLSPAQIYDYMNCSVLNNFKYSRCPEGYLLMDGMCYLIKDKPRNFHQAESRCLSPPDLDGLWVQKMAGTNQSYFLERLLNLAEGYIGNSVDLWVGIEDRNNDESWEDSSGNVVAFNNDSIWHANHSSSTRCAYISSAKPGYLHVDKCNEEKPYACVRQPRDSPHNNHCPLGYISYKKTCLMPSHDLFTYDKAKEKCALSGGLLFAPKDVGELSFMQGFAYLNSKILKIKLCIIL